MNNTKQEQKLFVVYWGDGYVKRDCKLVEQDFIRVDLGFTTRDIEMVDGLEIAETYNPEYPETILITRVE